MNIPYGFDCYAFARNELKFFHPNTTAVRSSLREEEEEVVNRKLRHPDDFVLFTRKNEDYTKEQLRSLVEAGRLQPNESSNKQIFCGIKIQIGIGVVTNFLQRGLKYRSPIRGRSELVNGSWTGIVSGLTMDHKAKRSYDLAFGNFLAYDEEFPYIKFGPFFALESKLVMLTGSSRQIEASSFGTNMNGEVWLTTLSLMLILSLLAAFRVHWQSTKRRAVEATIRTLIARRRGEPIESADTRTMGDNASDKSLLHLIQNFFFIYFTMLLNKPSLEFDELIWPKHNLNDLGAASRRAKFEPIARDKGVCRASPMDKQLERSYGRLLKRRRRQLPTSLRILSYLWSAACLVMASIYSGELLAVILLHADQNIDTISQLINSKPPIEPVIRQDDFTYNLMLKSLDENMLILHNKTKIIARSEVYTSRFIEGVSNRKQALLGDDELIETIYDIYHKYYPLYKSKVTYLQYPISIMYRKNFDQKLEGKLRRGIVQIFEMGLIQRWYQAQKDTYIQFYDFYEKKKAAASKDEAKAAPASNSSGQKYKPLSMQHFKSFLKLMSMCTIFALFILALEILHWRSTRAST